MGQQQQQQQQLQKEKGKKEKETEKGKESESLSEKSNELSEKKPLFFPKYVGGNYYPINIRHGIMNFVVDIGGINGLVELIQPFIHQGKTNNNINNNNNTSN